MVSSVKNGDFAAKICDQGERRESCCERLSAAIDTIFQMFRSDPEEAERQARLRIIRDLDSLKLPEPPLKKVV